MAVALVIFLLPASLAVFLIRDQARPRPPSRGAAIAAALAYVYSLRAVGGSGQETVYWGFLLLIAGLPVCGFMIR